MWLPSAREVCAVRPTSARPCWTTARAKESIPHFIDALRIDPNQPIARCNLASALHMIGATNQGDRRIAGDARHAPNFAPAHAALADIFPARGISKLRWSNTTAALAINPDEQVAHFNLAQLLARMGRREAPSRSIWKWCGSTPRNATAHYNLANLLAESGHEAEAISHYTAAARFDPHNARSQINLGNLFLKQGRPDDAIAAYTEALRVDPNAFKAHNNLAVILASRGDLVHATEHFREAVRLMPGRARGA